MLCLSKIVLRETYYCRFFFTVRTCYVVHFRIIFDKVITSLIVELNEFFGQWIAFFYNFTCLLITYSLLCFKGEFMTYFVDLFELRLIGRWKVSTLTMVLWFCCESKGCRGKGVRLTVVYFGTFVKVVFFN